jgi:hypothetical protein
MYRMRNSKRRERTLAALAEMRAMIEERFLDATFSIVEGDDPPGIYLRPVVDVGNILDVLDVVQDKLLEYQVEQRLPVYVFPTRPGNSTVSRNGCSGDRRPAGAGGAGRVGMGVGGGGARGTAELNEAAAPIGGC